MALLRQESTRSRARSNAVAQIRAAAALSSRAMRRGWSPRNASVTWTLPGAVGRPPDSAATCCASVASTSAADASGQSAKNRRRAASFMSHYIRTRAEVRAGQKQNGHVTRKGGVAGGAQCQANALLCVGDRELRLRLVEELLVFGRSLERGRRRPGALDRLRHRVKVAGPHLALVLDRGESLGYRCELRFLQLDERRHLAASVAVRQIEHAVVQAMEAGQGDELELVAHRAQLALEAGHGRIVKVLFPVERWRAVVRQHLVRELRMDRVGEGLGEFEVGLARLAPEEVGVGGVCEPARHRLIEPAARLVETLDRGLTGAERLVVCVGVGGYR